MNCLECRRLILINPNDENPARLVHVEDCTGCAAFASQMLAQDELIREATKVDIPVGFAARILLNQSLQPESRRPTRLYWLGLAASFLLAAALLPTVVEETFFHPFETELITHVNAHNVLSGGASDHVSAPGTIREVLAAAGTDMPANVGNILYAATCVVDGEVMAHLLVENGEHQYVVFLIPQSSVIERSFSNDNWSGRLARVNNRSIAVLARDGSALQPATDAFAKQFNRQLSGDRQSI